jgi:hypothetical protein
MKGSCHDAAGVPNKIGSTAHRSMREWYTDQSYTVHTLPITPNSETAAQRLPLFQLMPGGVWFGARHVTLPAE